MAKILSIAYTEMLKKTRHLILEAAGHEVFSFSIMPGISDLEYSGKPDLAVVGHGFPGPEKRMIALKLNQQFPGLPILEMCMNSPEIPGADFILSHSPEHLVIAVRDVLAGRRVRGFPG